MATSALAAMSLFVVAGTARADVSSHPPRPSAHKLSPELKRAMRKAPKLTHKRRPVARVANFTADRWVYADARCSVVGQGSMQGASMSISSAEPRIWPKNGASGQWVAVAWGLARYANATYPIMWWDDWHRAYTESSGFFQIGFNGPGAFTTYKTVNMSTGRWDIGDYSLSSVLNSTYQGDAYKPILRVSWWNGTAWGPVSEYPISVDGVDNRFCAF